MKTANLLASLALICMAVPQLAHSEELKIYPMSSTPRLLLKGKIGDYPVAMNLFLYPETVYGNYSYQGKHSSLELIGTLKYSEVRLYEYVNHLNTGVFEGKLSVNRISGTWRSVNKRDFSLPFKLSLEMGTFDNHSFRYVSSNIFLIQLEEKTVLIDLSKEISNPVCSCKTVFEGGKNGHYYGVIRLDGFSLGVCRDRSYCGCGVETQFVWIDLDPDFNVSRRTVVFTDSCLRTIELDQREDVDRFFGDRERTKLQTTGKDFSERKEFSIEFDKASPEKGFVVVTEPIEK